MCGKLEYFRFGKPQCDRIYDKAVEIKPDLHDAWYNRGVTLGSSERYEEAIASFDKWQLNTINGK
ncbi:MAG: tetratricopeptide repeat protein [Fischerella sp. CENA71]|nr:tetratricopeptide repeat protein [Fischerella sp. CENA71]